MWMNAEMTSASVSDPMMNSHWFDEICSPVTRITRPSISISRPVRLSGRRSHTTAPSEKKPTPDRDEDDGEDPAEVGQLVRARDERQEQDR